MQRLMDALFDYTVAAKDYRRECSDGEELPYLWDCVEAAARPQGWTGSQALKAYSRRR